VKRCFLKFGDGEPQPFEVDATGYSYIESGVYAARGAGIFNAGRWRVRIGEKLDHLGGKTNRGGAVYAAEVISRPEQPEQAGNSLFNR
jgi:hypothetical protein